MIDQTVSGAWVRGIAEMLHAAGLNIQALFQEADMDLATLDNSQTRFTSDKINLLWQLAALKSNNPAISIAHPDAVKPTSFDVVAYAMMSCENLLTSLERLVCYLRIVSNAANISLIKDSEGVWLSLDILSNGKIVPRQRIEFDLITLLTFCRWVTRLDLHPLAVEFTYPTPEDIQPYFDAFRCTVTFNAAANRLLFSTADLTSSLPTSNPMLATLHDHYAGEHLARLDSTRISFKIRELIIRKLTDGEPLRRDVAQMLGLSERTLQRRLQEEGTSYHQLVDDTRRDLAQQYLSQPRLALEQMTYLLGFTDQSTFCRACKRWFDISPGQYRLQLTKP